MTHEARELEMYVINTECCINPITDCLTRRMDEGGYTHDWAMTYLIRRLCEPAKCYHMEHCGTFSLWQDMFGKQVRTECATSLLERIRGTWRHDHDKV